MSNQTIFYQVHPPEDGDQNPVFLVHGAGGSRLHWPGSLRRIPGRQVFALDLPGHGRSDGDGKQQISEYGEALVNWLNAEDHPPGVMIGHSMGGAIAIWTAVHHQDRLGGLVLIGTGGHLPVNPWLLDALADPGQFEAAVEKITRWSFNPSAERDLIENSREQLLSVDRSVLRGDFLACSQYDLRDHLEQIQLPTLILVGEEDKMTPVALSRELAQQIPNSRMEEIPEAGHMVMIEKPAEIGGRVRVFLERLGQPRSIA